MKENRKILNVLMLILFSTMLSCNPNSYKKKETIKEPAIFIMAGQSNMAGRGKVYPKDTLVSDRIISVNNKGVWIKGKEPLHFYEPRRKGLDCGMTFANHLLDRTENVIGLLPCAVGGTSIEDWLENKTKRGVKLYSNFEEKVKIGKAKGYIAALLWHQGESNLGEEELENYDLKLAKLIRKFRKTIGNMELPIFIGELGNFEKTIFRNNQIIRLNSILKKYTDSDKNAFLISSKGLEHKGDEVHFDSNSIRELGRRYAEKYIELQKSIIDK